MDNKRKSKLRARSGQMLIGLVTAGITALVVFGAGAAMLLSNGTKAGRNQRIDDGTATPKDYQSAQDDGNKLKRTIEIGVGGAGFIGEGGPIGPGGAVGPDFHGPAGDLGQVVKAFTDDATSTIATTGKPPGWWKKQPPASPTTPTTPTAPSCSPPPSCAPPPGCSPPPSCKANDMYQNSLTGTGTEAGGFSVTGNVTSTTPPQPTPTTTVPACP